MHTYQMHTHTYMHTQVAFWGKKIYTNIFKNNVDENSHMAIFRNTYFVLQQYFYVAYFGKLPYAKG